MGIEDRGSCSYEVPGAPVATRIVILQHRIFGQDVGQPTGEEDLLHGEEDVDRASSLPNRLSKLTEGHFPLFVSYDQVSLSHRLGRSISYTLVA